jgi:hypothetical protein
LQSVSPSIVDVHNYKDLFGKSWNFSYLALGKFLEYARRPGYSELTLSPVVKLLPQIFTESVISARANSNVSNFVLGLTYAEGPSTGFSSDEDVVVYFSPDGRAFSAIGLRGKVVLNSSFRAIRFEDFRVASWVWAAVNSRLFTHESSAIKALAIRLGVEDEYFDLLGLPDLPLNWSDRLPQVISLMEDVSNSARHVSHAGSIVRSTPLEAGRKWRLRGTSLFDTKTSQGKPLSDFISACRPGRSIDTDDLPTEISVYDSKWMRTGIVSKYSAIGDVNAVLAQPGDIITPKTGTISRARLVEAAGAVDANGFILTPKSAQDANEILAFLNSVEASDQRIELCEESSIVKKIESVDLQRMIVFGNTIDIEKACAAIVRDAR